MGSATATQPADGWETSDLSVYFGRLYLPTNRSPTRSIPPTATSSATGAAEDRVNVGAIAGGTVGGVVALVAAITLLICYRVRKRRKDNAFTPASEVPMHDGAPHMFQGGHDMGGLMIGQTHDREHPSEETRGSPPSRVSLRSPWSQSYSPNSQDGKWQSNMPLRSHPQECDLRNVALTPEYQQRPSPPFQQHQYFPPPPDPQRYDDTEVMHEMPSVRSPALLDSDRSISAAVNS